PVVACSAVDDRWADPRGEFLAAKLASPVYALFGYRGIEQDDLPATNQLVGDRIGYQIRPGKHDMTDIDWHAYLEFGDRYLKK
ncbi:MAG: acetylxylan esterase, partial [Planctomycetales bacterium]|nr:acetylxylan esterase [Planctomycetales bacterium]